MGSSALSYHSPALITYSGLAVWLLPAKPEKFSSLINSLASTYASPSFSPHITLLSSIPIELESQVEKILNSIQVAVKLWQEGMKAQNILVEVKKVGTTPAKIFQYLYLELDLSPALLRLQSILHQAITILEQSNDHSSPNRSIYFPHLSLMYGEDSLEQNRIVQDIIKSLEGKMEDWKKKEIECYEIALFKCDGVVSEWKELGRIHL